MSPVLRRIIYVITYEGLAILSSGLILMALGHQGLSAGVAAVASSAVAMAWNFVFTTLFEWWESGNPVKGRSTKRRVVHALLFESGLTIVLTPVLVLALGVPVREAFVTNAGLLLYFLAYTYIFNLGFDRIFGLPESARPRHT
ncbi:PACE efflux transporter [Ciceribacter sp. L1K23]|uniref:PACE efflux transporter n=1 Tax=unclassified Ciceribacter TaxID=2628820 RepID=UPI001ABEB8DD|nr:MULTISPECIES: PACE efflux transporter [unclassified Ciceribacter]MBO3759276.1 PACE efflux transporter [Ciceribacter sp. L1K22]MBR0556404.1 PACE efflux transporter [Ciceribacter sp. L1K23]